MQYLRVSYHLVYTRSDMKFSIRLFYLYLFSFVGLLITVIGCIQLVNLGMKIFIFPDSDNYSYYAPKPIADVPGEQTKVNAENEEARQKEEQQKDRTRNRQREATNALSMILVGIPLYLYHWKTIQKEHKPD